MEYIRRGKVFYLVKRFLLRNTNSSILNKELDNGIGYAEKMPNWTKYKGFPVVHVTIVNNSYIEVDQRPFSINSEYEKNAKHASDLEYLKQRWHIPFTYTVETLNSDHTSFTNFVDLNNLSDKVIWINPKDNRTRIPLNESLSANKFILANIDFSGFYRVNYDAENWEKIIQQLTHNKDVRESCCHCANLTYTGILWGFAL